VSDPTFRVTEFFNGLYTKDTLTNVVNG